MHLLVLSVRSVPLAQAQEAYAISLSGESDAAGLPLASDDAMVERMMTYLYQ
jgi:hypothetical protein